MAMVVAIFAPEQHGNQYDGSYRSEHKSKERTHAVTLSSLFSFLAVLTMVVTSFLAFWKVSTVQSLAFRLALMRSEARRVGKEC